MVTGCALMVIPRSFTRSMPSSNWSSMSRSEMVPVRKSRRSESVVFPWSIWAMMLKFLMCAASIQSSNYARHFGAETGYGYGSIPERPSGVRIVRFCVKQKGKLFESVAGTQFLEHPGGGRQ